MQGGKCWWAAGGGGAEGQVGSHFDRPLESNPRSLEYGTSGWTPLKGPHRGEVLSGLEAEL